MKSPTTLVMFSGGLDSTCVLWRLVNGDEELHVHHLHLVNKENRAAAENKAVTDIVAHLRGVRHFGFSESYHEYPCYGGGFMWDSDIFSFMAGSICLGMKTIERVAIGMTLSDMRGGLSHRVERANKIFEAFGTKARKVYPVGQMTKKQIYEALPEKLRMMSWSCRTPIYKDDDMVACGKCKTCREVERIKSAM
jgi:7-cyano-7-deazaguanine synthase in queuosine biosynthesis